MTFDDSWDKRYVEDRTPNILLSTHDPVQCRDVIGIRGHAFRRPGNSLAESSASIAAWTLAAGSWWTTSCDKANRYIFAYYRRARPSMKTPELARIASDGTEDLTKIRWPFSVMIKKHVRVGTTLWERIVKVFGARAVLGHTAVPFLEDDRLQVSAASVPYEVFACIAHHTQEEHLHSIMVNGRFAWRGWNHRCSAFPIVSFPH